ncbi:peptidase M23 [Megasphaera cerevisiae DSM 20462]|jgi:murein DD-endopeptidase MepM/ murein hydrolase activator NlpD|uniref:Peptidase M23 n=1 Tax=Megasphaera cerevisiae DSM 20462 TaxID=1122219 RepID=A0A0J6WW28_9FIRM|nr:M23 family metallopeptidase [Megasphaera cerevisiae]KMO86789.1 peptidase M23 [Megasphaera cerevisiae DSM 20462]MCI1750702.1 peptidoglycan DD-metalloendopeptidase family protein [Megasphaera cerevisiae]OKY54485.1 peptidase M23 [Megasphaera cerevisiae]SJZ35416.1 Septal ring factor EnvC, activator of murein hydrolases AmiA and AmiB [Megasphaera cerevisiae DSM 20462]
MLKFESQKKYIAIWVTAALLSPSFVVFAEDEDLQNQLSDVQGQMNEQTQKKNDADAVIGNVFDKLRVIQENLDAAVRDYKAISDQLAQTEAQIKETQAKLEQEEAKLQTREGVFRKRIRDIYMHGQLSYLDVVLGAKDFSDFANRVDLLRRIISSDMELITSIKEQRNQINESKQLLETERAKQVQLKSDAEAKKAEIEKHKGEQQAIMAKAQNDKATAEAAYRELEASSQAIGEMLRQRAAERAAAAAAAAAAAQPADSGGSAPSYQATSGSGTFIWPVNGVITSPFGYRTHPIFGTSIFHSGIDIGVDYGTPVHAADSGVVVDAGWISGYGYAVIIDHGNGLSTLYGHNESLAVSAGQSVSQGQVIAYAGSTGNSTGPHVHFEVRVNGDPVDPMSYL